MNISNMLQLHDNRQLGFACYGNPEDKPILFFHGAPGSRREHHPDLRILEQLGIRLIIPDRPGYGLSDPDPNRSMISWAKDISTLLDHLGIRPCPFLGYSGGGPYAMACAIQLPKRVTRLGLVSSLAPMDIPHITDGMNEQSLALFHLAQTDADAFTAQIQALVTSGDVLFHIMAAGLPQNDQVILNHEPVHAMYLADMNEAVASGIDGIVSDMLLYPHPWGFTPAQILCPTLLWQGMADINVPPAMGQHLAEEIPNCEPFFIPEQAHYLLFNHWSEILSELIKT